MYFVSRYRKLEKKYPICKRKSDRLRKKIRINNKKITQTVRQKLRPIKHVFVFHFPQYTYTTRCTCGSCISISGSIL